MEDRIKIEAKAIIDKFSKALDRVKLRAGKSLKTKNSGMRQEKSSKTCKEDFREIFFENSPRKESNFILAEKKQW